MQPSFFEIDESVEPETTDAARQHLMRNIARAAEHFVAGDILQRNWACTMAAEGLRYDLIAEILIPRRIQVKMCQRPMFKNPGGKHLYYKYGQSTGGLRPSGKTREGGRLKDYVGAIDLFAFVAFDKRRVIYVLPENIPTYTLKIRASEFTDERSELSWSEALREWGVE